MRKRWVLFCSEVQHAVRNDLFGFMLKCEGLNGILSRGGVTVSAVRFCKAFEAERAGIRGRKWGIWPWG